MWKRHAFDAREKLTKVLSGKESWDGEKKLYFHGRVLAELKGIRKLFRDVFIFARFVSILQKGKMNVSRGV